MTEIDPAYAATKLPKRRAIGLDGLTENGRVTAERLNRNLSSLYGYAQDFRTSVGLFQYLKSLWYHPELPTLTLVDWSVIAAKQAAVDVYNLDAVLRGIDSERRRDKAYFARMDNAKFVATCVDFRREFPSIRSLRQAVMHQGDLRSNVERAEENRTKKDYRDEKVFVNVLPGGDVMMSLANERFLASHAGEMHAMDISVENAAYIKTIIERISESFEAYYEE